MTAAGQPATGCRLTSRMAAVLERIRRAGRPAFHTLDVADARSAYEAAAEILDLPRARLARVVDFTIPAADGVPLGARLYAATHDALPLLLYFHGGGFTIGGLETHDSLCRQLAVHSGAAVVALDYRLAPEHRFPVAVDDCWSAMRWLHAHSGTLGCDGSRLAVGGDSAGGTLAAVCAIHARDLGLSLRGQVLITPGTAAFGEAGSRRELAQGLLLEEIGIEWFFRHYIDGAQRTDWRFAPLEADDLERLAPALLVLAECDPLVDEGLAYGDRLRAARVPVELELCAGVTHDFIKMGRALPEAPAAQATIGEWLRRQLQHRPGR